MLAVTLSVVWCGAGVPSGPEGAQPPAPAAAVAALVYPRRRTPLVRPPRVFMPSRVSSDAMALSAESVAAAGAHVVLPAKGGNQGAVLLGALANPSMCVP